MNTKGPRASAAGFTMIEMLVVVVIMAVGTSIAVPAYNNWVARADLKQGITEIYGGLRLAKTVARSQNRTITVTLSNIAGHVEMSSNDGMTNTASLGGHVTNVAPGGAVAFNSLGLLVAGGPLITLTNNQGLQYSIAVTPAGKLNWCPRATCP